MLFCVANGMWYFSAFFDLSSLLILFLVLGVTLLRNGRTFAYALALMPDREKGTAGSVKALDELYQSSVLGGVLGLCVGVAVMLAFFDPEFIGQGMAISLLCPLYASSLSTLFFQPLATVMRNRGVI